MNRILFLIMVWLSSMSILAQTDGYDPANPPLPEAKYKLTLNATPTGAGTFNVSSATLVKGEAVSLYAYTNTNFKFVKWMDAKADTLVSEAQNFSYVMPGSDMSLMAVYEYAPENPKNPGRNKFDSSTGEVIVDDFTPGSLSSAIQELVGNDKSSVAKITVVGVMSNNDFSIANYNECTVVDLSRTSGITALPSYCYYNIRSLKSLLLPYSISRIESYAFNGATSLAELTCLSEVPPTLGNRVFDNVTKGISVFVPIGAEDLYEQADVWKDYVSDGTIVIVPAIKGTASLEVNLPDECRDGRYKNMSLELVNVISGQKNRYVVTDRLNYTFNTLMHNTRYVAMLKNLSGVVLACTDTIDIVDENQSVSFVLGEMKKMRTVRVSVAGASDVTNKCTIAWYDTDGTLLSQSLWLPNQVAGTKVRCSVALPQSLGMKYIAPSDTLYEVVEDDNNIELTLVEIPRMTIRGKVIDSVMRQGVDNATITVSQTLNGKYSKSFTAKTNNRGEYSVEIFAVPSSVTFAQSDYVSQSIELSDSVLSLTEAELEDVKLRSISGAVITTKFTYTERVLDDEQPDVADYYSDYNNVDYVIYDETAQRAVTQFSVQYPQIVLQEEVAEGDSLTIVAHSKKGAFMDVTASGTMDAKLQMEVTFPIVQLGGIQASFTTTENTNVSAILYDADGNFVNRYSYRSSVLQIKELKDGNYTLITMGANDFFGSMYNLSQFKQVGLVENVDYVSNRVVVRSGAYTQVKNAVVPFFDESKFYYTGENTSFSVNKNSIVAGNYLTFTAKVDFKNTYSDNVEDVKLRVELPKGAQLVDNSVMVGSSLAYYEYDANTVTIPLSENTVSERVRFCVIPTESGSFAPNAIVAFMLNEKQLEQPIGSAQYKVESVAINVPTEINTPKFVVNGVAAGYSEVKVYANNVLLGTTKALANGCWQMEAELSNPYNLQQYYIYADIHTKAGADVKTETKSCLYNENQIVAKSVEMSFYNGWMRKNISVTFDLENKTGDNDSYMFYTGTDITFKADLSNNDTTIVKDVVIGVYTNRNEWVYLDASYDKNIDKWIAVRKFESNNLPIGVKVFVTANIDYTLDAKNVEDGLNAGKNFAEYMTSQTSATNELADSILKMIADGNSSMDEIDSKLAELMQLAGYVSKPEYNDIPVDQLVEESEKLLEQSMYDNMMSVSQDDFAKLSELLEGATITRIEGKTAEELIADGFVAIQCTDGKELFYKLDENQYIMAYLPLSMQVAYDLTSETGRMLKAALYSSNGADELQVWCDRVELVCSKLISVTETASSCVDNIIELTEALSGKIANKLDGVFGKLLQHGEEAFLTDDEVLKLKGLNAKLCKVLRQSNKISQWLKDNFACLRIGPNAGKAFALFDICYMAKDIKENVHKITGLYGSVPNCPDEKDTDDDKLRRDILAWGIGCSSYYLLKVSADIASIETIYTGIMASIPTGGTSLSAVGIAVGVLAANFFADKAYNWQFEKNKENFEQRIRGIKCTDDKCPKCHQKPCVCKQPCHVCGQSPCICNYCPVCGHYPCTCIRCKDCMQNPCVCVPKPQKNPIHDPSGFVYEGVSSNRLQGVMATCYYKEMVEDMYGDMHENIVLWNAEDYAQKNPLFTDENGMYQWDVPQGLWQVRFEKEGYVPTQSEWLPVPPPQMDVNIAMVQISQPEVIGARAYDDGVEIEFSKYMDIESLNKDNVYLKLIKDGKSVLVNDAAIEMVNAEVAVEGSDISYASKMRLATDRIGYYDEAFVIVSKNVCSYAGINMAENYQQKLDVEQRVRELIVDKTLNVAYGGDLNVVIAAQPAEAAAGKRLIVESASSQIASTDVEFVDFDADGHASLLVKGELLGTTALKYKLESNGMEAVSLVNVVDSSLLAKVKAPRASRLSGTSVYRGQTVALTTDSKGATIYYTTDGSCPCDAATRVKYERPIVVNEAMTIKAMAIGVNDDESEVNTYVYDIRKSEAKLNLSQGWNWNSHDLASPLAVSQLNASVARVLTQTEEVVNDPDFGFVGSLEKIDAIDAMKIYASEVTEMAFSGEQYNPASESLYLHQGWNWLGYPLSVELTLDDALSMLDVDEDDCIESLDGGFATYSDGEWVGDLHTMKPGHGYLYKSASDKSFIYNSVSSVANAAALYGHRLELGTVPCVVDKHKYPNIMPMVVELDDEKGLVNNNSCYVVAVSGNEYRGVGQIKDDKLFLSVYGNDAESIQFFVIDTKTGNQCYVKETITFVPDMIGTVRTPYVLHIGEATGIDSLTNGNSAADGIYTINGMRVNNPVVPGVYIKKHVDVTGNARMSKCVVK